MYEFGDFKDPIDSACAEVYDRMAQFVLGATDLSGEADTAVEHARQAYGLVKCEFLCQPPSQISKFGIDRLGELLRTATAAA